MEHGSSLMAEDLVSSLRLSITMGEYTHCADNWKDFDYTPDYNKFYLIEGGEGWLKIDGREFWPKPGHLCFMPAGVIQSFSTISSNTFRKYWCHFTAKVGDIELFDMVDVPYFVDAGNDMERLTALFRKLLGAMGGSGLSASLTSRSALLEIIAYYLDKAGAGNLKFKHISSLHKLNTALSYIDAHIDRDISAAELARQLHYHPNYFTRMFRKYTGMAPTQYINKTKLEKAKILLNTTDMRVTEVASATGFGDIYYFSKCFKKYTGFSPSDYRAMRMN